MRLDLKWIPIVALTVSLASAGSPATLYVAPNGNDAWSGASRDPAAGGAEGPLASLTGARNRIRKLSEQAPGEAVRVVIRGGTYRMTEPFVLEPQDSGTSASPIVYAAAPSEKPLFLGGKAIRGWKKETNGRWTAAIPEVEKGPGYFSQLFVNGARRTRARSPNSDFYMVQARVAEPLNDPRNNRAFGFRPGDIKDWRDPDVEVVVLHSWETSRLRIASVDLEKNVVEFTGPAAWPFTQWDPHQRYYVENLAEALDEPGEWRLDRKSGILTYWPLPGEEPETAEAFAPILGQFVLFAGNPEQRQYVKNVTLSGLTFLYAAWDLPATGYSDSQAAHSVPAVIEMKGARLCAIEECEVAHVGTYGLRVRRGSRDVRIERNHFRDLGAGGIGIGEMNIEKDKDLTVTRAHVTNNYLHDGGHVYKSGVGVWIGQSSDNTIANNEISDFGYTGVSVGWTWGYGESAAQRNIVEYNHIHHIGDGALSDMGGIYTLGDSTGSILRYNHIHHVLSYYYGGWGIYPDEGTSNLLIENNVVHDTKTGGFHQHYGKENLVRNNVFAFSLSDQIVRSRAEEHRSFRFERNIVYYDQGELLGTQWDDDRFFLDDNVYWNVGGPVVFKGLGLEQWRDKKNIDWHSLVADPRFVNPERRDFGLSASSPALALGIREIDLGRTGLQGPREWRRLPKQFSNHRQVWPAPPKSSADEKDSKR